MDIGKIFIIVTLMAFFCVLIVVTVISKRREKQYDERQLVVRNAAFKAAFFTLVFYCLICGALDLLQILWASLAMQMLLGTVISFTVFSALCIIKDAYYLLAGKQKWRYIIGLFAMGLVDLLYTLTCAVKGGSFMDSDGLAIAALYPVTSVCFCVLGVISVVKVISDNRSGEE